MKYFKSKGFFLIETMVVIGIVGIVITFLFATFSNLYNNFNAGEYYDTIDATNAAAQIRLFLQNKELEAEDLIGSEKYVEITNLSTLNDDYFMSLKNNLNLSRIFIINLQTFYTDASIDNFSINAKGYLNSIKDDIAQYKIFVITKNNTYGSVSVLNYTLTLNGDPDNEYAAYLIKDDMYIDPGFTALDSKGNNMEVTITGFVDNTTPGTYYLTYNLGILSARRKVVVYEKVHNYAYTGNYQIFTAPMDGTYKVQLWGASGGGISGYGKGGYVSGEIYLFEGQVFYVYVGQNNNVQNAESFNGSIGNSGGFPGGGATDIRLVSGNWKDINSLKSRIIIAAGGGAGNINGAHAGGLIGLYPSIATGGTQTAPGSTQLSTYYPASFGIGGGGCGGGGGYYGGGGSSCGNGGAGGSAFISGHTGCNAITQTGIHTGQTVHYSGYKFSNTVMYAGNQSFVSPTGSNETGHIGNGYARITLIEPSKINIMSNVRYIYTQTNGNYVNNYNHFVEVQAFDRAGVNVAYEKIVSEASYKTGIQSFWARLTDGAIISTSYVEPVTTGLHWAVVDLGEEYDLSSIRIWHYYADSRKYKLTETRVAGSDKVYRVVDNLEYMETPDGRIIRP